MKANLRLPESFVAAQHDTPMMRHFYSPAERAAFQRQWSIPGVDCGGKRSATAL
jgi:hypothetical protein